MRKAPVGKPPGLSKAGAEIQPDLCLHNSVKVVSQTNAELMRVEVVYVERRGAWTLRTPQIGEAVTKIECQIVGHVDTYTRTKLPGESRVTGLTG